MRKTVLSPAGGDVAGELLRDVRIASSVLCRSVMGAPWGFGVAARRAGSFHVVLRGRGYLEVEGRPEPVELAAGDRVVLPRGHAHWVRDAPATAAPWLTTILDRNLVVDGELHFGGDEGPTTEIVCGIFHLEGADPPWLERLPSAVVSHGDDADAHRRSEIGAALRDEARDPTPGGAVVVNRLLEALLADALSRELASLALDAPPSVRAIADRRIGATLARLHDAPEEAWTVQQMAKVATMSRSAFAERFRTLVGSAPMAYLTELRLARAARLLRSSDLTTEEIARRIGYGSNAALARAFRSRYGVTPAAFRARALPREVR